MRRMIVHGPWIRRSAAVLLGFASASAVLADTTTVSVSSDGTPTINSATSADMTFTVTRGGDLKYDAYIPWHTVDGTAVAGTNYTAASGVLVIPAGSTSGQVTVTALGASAASADKTFTLQLDQGWGTGPAPAFGVPQSFTPANPPSMPVFADVNGDGKPDLVMLGSGAVQVSINATAPGATTPSFVNETSFPVTNDGLVIRVADMDGDGRPDIVVLGSDNTTVKELLNTTTPGATTPSFAAPVSVNAGSCFTACETFTVADVNGDGKPDLIVPDAEHTVTVRINTAAQGQVAFGTPQTFAVGNTSTGVETADFNGDGKLDVVSLDANDQTLSVLINTTTLGAATASFAARASFGTGRFPRWLAVADLNGDGKPDMVVADFADDTASVYIDTTAPGATTATFTARAPFGIGQGTKWLGLRDVNGDGRPDIVALANDDNAFSVLENLTGPGSTAADFSAQAIFTLTGTNTAYGAVGDLNGDGKPDLLAVSADAADVEVLFNGTVPDGAAVSFTAHQDLGTGTGPGGLAVADMNGDGLPDLVEPDSGDGTVSVLLNSTAPGSTTPSYAARQSFSTGSSPQVVRVADMNGDGLPDLVVSNFLSGTVSVLLNTTTPGSTTLSFVAHADFSTDPSTFNLALGDLNGDGKPDVVASSSQDDDLAVLFNTTVLGSSSAGFTTVAPFFSVASGQPNGAFIADMNRDGLPDIMTANGDSAANSVSVMLNTTSLGSSTPAFAAHQDFGVGTTPFAVSAADVNGDGSPDLLVVDKGGNKVSVLLNTTTQGSATLSFNSDQEFSTGTSPRSVASADLDGDGRTDLVTANAGGGVSVLLNTTAPGATTASFATQQSYAAGATPQTVAIADLNEDGQPDLAVGNTGESSLSVLFNTRYAVAATTASASGTIHYDFHPVIQLSSSSVSFGSILFLTNAVEQKVVLKNTGNGPLTGVGYSLTGDTDDFFVNNQCPTTLAPGASCNIFFDFSALEGGALSATYTITSSAPSSPDSVALTATTTDTAPTPVAGSVDTTVGHAVSGNLTATTNTGQTLTFSIASGASHGDVTLDDASTGAFTYTPSDGYLGPDSFTFQVQDQLGTQSAAATESLSVGDVAGTPTAASHSVSIDHILSSSLKSTPAYTGQTLRYAIVTRPKHGTVALTNVVTGAFRYTPTTGYLGSDSFTFRVKDSLGTASGTAKISLSVKDLAPKAHAGSLTVTAGVTTAGRLSGSVAYTGQKLTYVLLRKPTHGTVTLTSASTGTFSYRPKAGFKGTDNFTFEVKDSHGAASTAATESLSVR